MAELTPLAAKADNLQWREAEYLRHVDDVAGMLQDLAARAWQDTKEAARVQKQWDELLQRNAETRQWIIGLLDELAKERELKL